MLFGNFIQEIRSNKTWGRNLNIFLFRWESWFTKLNKQFLFKDLMKSDLIQWIQNKFKVKKATFITIIMNKNQESLAKGQKFVIRWEWW